ncbi:hypothetical protein O181_017790 [Austropuccinia psidii MF-1]|uniref:Uncharacterized protein n=1 Tax=Austropuccinia psidii MF-1 TaxID=1389203 RepID=A0A9Q3GTD4_9BASI|nr:hypothetical protein [Austropuccinia psidii MF-1]
MLKEVSKNNVAHVWWHATICLAWFLGLLFTQMLALVQDPNASHTNPYTCPGSQCFICKTLPCKSLGQGGLPTIPEFLMLVQAPEASHADPYACTGSQQFKKLIKPGKPPGKSITSLPSAGSQHFTCRSLHFYRFLTIQTIPYTGEASQKF